jgi:antitoxin (DNA-binding transcriptional repressor) of toxin-antitoxin stability system
MPTYSVAEAKDQFSRLVDRALAGEEVTITRHGKPVAELRARTTPERGRPSPHLIDELERRAKRLPALGAAAADFVRAMRDEAP